MTQQYERGDLVLTGPLTNIALALRLDPTLAHRVVTVTIMGGCFDVEWAYAEFNFACDALAAAEVLSAAWTTPPTLVGLNVTCQAFLPHMLVEQIAESTDPVAITASAVLRSLDPLGWNEASGDGLEIFDACAFA